MVPCRKDDTNTTTTRNLVSPMRNWKTSTTESSTKPQCKTPSWSQSLRGSRAIWTSGKCHWLRFPPSFSVGAIGRVVSSTTQSFFCYFVKPERILSGILIIRPFFCEPAYDFYPPYILPRRYYPPRVGACDATCCLARNQLVQLYRATGVVSKDNTGPVVLRAQFSPVSFRVSFTSTYCASSTMTAVLMEVGSATSHAN
jgi:hypothetical protein